MNNRSIGWNLVGWLFGIVVLAIGVINMFWGNDPGYGVFIFLLAFAFFPPVNTILKAKTGYRIHPILKVLLGLFIFWSALYRMRLNIAGGRPIPVVKEYLMHV